jgi:hypothetical protein
VRELREEETPGRRAVRLPEMPAKGASAGEERVKTGCWCCGQECMFCGGNDTDGCCTTEDGRARHWCTNCKFGGCEWCCGCSGCHVGRRGGWSPEGIQVNHDGIRERKVNHAAEQ